MIFKEPELDEIIFKKMKSGKGTFDDILTLKKEYNINIIEIAESLQRLEDNYIIKQLNDKYIIR